MTDSVRNSNELMFIVGSSYVGSHRDSKISTAPDEISHGCHSSYAIRNGIAVIISMVLIHASVDPHYIRRFIGRDCIWIDRILCYKKFEEEEEENY